MSERGMNNFQRQTWLVLGAGAGITVTALTDWAVAVGWFIGGVLLPWVIYAFMCGYARVGRPRSEA